MSKVFYNLKAIPIPEDTYRDLSTKRVLAKVRSKDGAVKRKTIGALTTESTMYPNENFQHLFPQLWKQHYGNKELKEYELSIGMFGLVLGISHKLKLYDMLHDIYGESNVNYILDYVMYSLLDRTNTTQLYPERMKSEVLFAEQVYSDSWYSDFFKKGMPEKDNNEMRIQWLEHCKNEGITEVWLCIDGSNNDCEVKQCDLCEQREAKSHSHSDIIGYMYAVAGGSGLPVTYFVYEGSEPDQQAFHQIALFLKKGNIRIKGLILDAGFCTDKVMDTASECGFEYVIMMHSNFKGHTDMRQQYGKQIKWDPVYSVSDDGIFGISDKKQLFSTHPREGYVNLYFDGVRGSAQSIELSSEIRKEKRRLDRMISDGKRFPVVKESLRRYVEVVEIGDHLETAYNYQNWKKDAQTKGFFSITSSSNFGAEEVLEVYQLRDSSETRYSILKSQEGVDTTRVHSKESIYSKFTIGFIASIIRYEIEKTCKLYCLDTNVMIHNMDHIHIFLAPGHEYMFSRSIRADQTKLLNQFGITSGHFDALASEVNFRMDSGYKNRYRAVPELYCDKKRSKKSTTRESSNTDESSEDSNLNQTTEKKSRGRKKGSKDSYPRKRRTKAQIEADKQRAN